MIPIKVNTQPSPAINPARAPKPAPALAPINIARKNDAINESMNAREKILTILAFFVDSSVIPVSFIHLFAKSRGEYHNPPKIKALTAAAIIASQFKF